MSHPTSIRLSEKTLRHLNALNIAWETGRNATIAAAITQAHTVESARLTMTDSEFLGFLATLFSPVEGAGGEK